MGNVPVGVRAGRIGRGEEGTEAGGEVTGDMAEAANARGLQESLRRQLYIMLVRINPSSLMAQ